MTKANTTEKKITTPNANLRCWTLAGMLAMRAGTSLPASGVNCPDVSLIRIGHPHKIVSPRIR